MSRFLMIAILGASMGSALLALAFDGGILMYIGFYLVALSTIVAGLR